MPPITAEETKELENLQELITNYVPTAPQLLFIPAAPEPIVGEPIPMPSAVFFSNGSRLINSSNHTSIEIYLVGSLYQRTIFMDALRANQISFSDMCYLNVGYVGGFEDPYRVYRLPNTPYKFFSLPYEFTALPDRLADFLSLRLQRIQRAYGSTAALFFGNPEDYSVLTEVPVFCSMIGNGVRGSGLIRGTDVVAYDNTLPYRVNEIPYAQAVTQLPEMLPLLMENIKNRVLSEFPQPQSQNTGAPAPSIRHSRDCCIL